MMTSGVGRCSDLFGGGRECDHPQSRCDAANGKVDRAAERSVQRTADDPQTGRCCIAAVVCNNCAEPLAAISALGVTSRSQTSRPIRLVDGSGGRRGTDRSVSCCRNPLRLERYASHFLRCGRCGRSSLKQCLRASGEANHIIEIMLSRKRPQRDTRFTE